MNADVMMVARRIYDSEYNPRTLSVDIQLHLENPTAFVFKGPDFFIMGRPVNHLADPVLVLSPNIVHKNPDAWLVWLGIGEMMKFIQLRPYSLPWVGFQRKNDLRWYEASNMEAVATAYLQGQGKMR